MSLHIGAAPGEIAEAVLITGDPRRARYVAEQMLTDVHLYTQIRGMYGYTGLYNGKRVSVQGTGMGIPSTAIYLHELIHAYGAKRIIRIGTCGALPATLYLDQQILATEAYTDSATHLLYYTGFDVPAKADAQLLQHARDMASQKQIPVIEGPIFSTDLFYHDDPHRYDPWTNSGVLAVEMETSILYALAKKNNIQALSLLSVSDNIITRTAQTARDREEANVHQMVLALETAIASSR